MKPHGLMLRPIWFILGGLCGHIVHDIYRDAELEEAQAGWMECIDIAYHYFEDMMRFRATMGVARVYLDTKTSTCNALAHAKNSTEYPGDLGY